MLVASLLMIIGKVSWRPVQIVLHLLITSLGFFWFSLHLVLLQTVLVVLPRPKPLCHVYL